MIDTYTRLLEAVAETENEAVADAAITKLFRHLKSAGRMNMLPKIVHELRRVCARRRALAPRVEVAHKKDSCEALSQAALLGFPAREAQVNPALIHGWRAMGGGKIVDRSAKSALIKVYQKVVTT